AGLAAARFRLDPSPDSGAAAEKASASATWPWLHAQIGCWRGELLRDAAAASDARERFLAIGALRAAERAEAVLGSLGVRSPQGNRGAGPLSPRELQVAGLIAEGLSNPAIARRLYVSRPTVASHVGHILTKLGLTSRAQVAAWVAERRA